MNRKTLKRLKLKFFKIRFIFFTIFEFKFKKTFKSIKKINMNKKLISLGCVYIEVTPQFTHQYQFRKAKVLGMVNGNYQVLRSDIMNSQVFHVQPNQVKEVTIDTKELKETMEFLNEIGVENIKDVTSFTDLMSGYILKKINSQPNDIARIKFISELSKNGSIQ